MTTNIWLNALLIGDWFLLGIVVIGGIVLIAKFGKRGGKIIASFAGIIVICFLIGLVISAVSTPRDDDFVPPLMPMPSSSITR